MRVLALVPARGGSKGIPRKNVRSFAGHPLVAWSIAAGLQARSVHRLLVSTDDPEIREVALAYGAEAPFLRPAELAADTTTDLPVFEHALAELAREGEHPGLVVQLRPTSPLRPAGLVDDGVGRLLAEPRADSLRAVTEPSQNPYKMWRREGGFLTSLLKDVAPEAYNQPRQLLPGTLWQTGHLDVVRSSTLRRGTLSGRRILPLPVDPAWAVDIDTLEHWEWAEWLVRRRRLEVPEPRLVAVSA